MMQANILVKISIKYRFLPQRPNTNIIIIFFFLANLMPTSS